MSEPAKQKHLKLKALAPKQKLFWANDCLLSVFMWGINHTATGALSGGMVYSGLYGGGEGGTYYTRVPAYPSTYTTPLPTAPQPILSTVPSRELAGSWPPSTPTPTYQAYGSLGGVQWTQTVSPSSPQQPSQQPTLLAYPLQTGFLG